MDLKRIKIFSIGIFASSILLVISIAGLFLLGQYMASRIPPFTIENVQAVDKAKIALAAIFGALIVIFWLSLIIQTCRIDNDIVAHFFIWMSIFSFIPLFSLVLILRSSQMTYKERANKLQTLVNELENQDEIVEEQFYDVEAPEEISYETIRDDDANFIHENEYDHSLYEKPNKNKSKKSSSKKNKNYDEAFNQDFNGLFDFSVDENNKKEASKFNRDKYLSLKGTNYSKDKKEGKKKISTSKWNKLIDLVDQLERKEITERNFYKEKSKLLS